MKKHSLSIVVLFISCALTLAQETEKAESYRKWEIGINGGATIFTGEYNMYKEARFNHLNYWNNDICYDYGALAKKNFSHVFAIEAAWNYSNIKDKLTRYSISKIFPGILSGFPNTFKGYLGISLMRDSENEL